jgi:hypothetical protein
LSVVEQLGVADLAHGLADARQLWQAWVDQDPRLASAPAVDGLRDWLMLVGIDAADEVLHALVRIGSPSGRDCRPAAWVVAWALLPGANAVARRAPASAIARTSSKRALGVGVPGSSAAWMVSSVSAIDTPMLTGTARLATASSGRSHRAVVPLVKIENGVPDPASAAMMSGISR